MVEIHDKKVFVHETKGFGFNGMVDLLILLIIKLSFFMLNTPYFFVLILYHETLLY